MSSAKLTPWFDGTTKPVRKGVYQREYGARRHSDICFSYWDGVRWRWPSETAQTARDYGREMPPSTMYSLPWRGLANRPKGGVA